MEKAVGWFPLLAGALGLAAMVLPRLPPILTRDSVGGVIPIDPFSGGLLDVNAMLTSALLVAFAGVMTALRPVRAWQLAVIFALAPTAWMVIAMVLHGPGNLWPIALAFALGYGAPMAAIGVGLGKSIAWFLTTGGSPHSGH